MNTVECVSSSTYAERPTVLVWEGQRKVVKTIEGQWRTPVGVGFRVLTTDGQIFELFYGEEDDEWIIHQP